MKKFSQKKGIPLKILHKAPIGKTPLTWTEHGRQSAMRYMSIVIPQLSFIDINHKDIVEMELEDGEVEKIVVRKPLLNSNSQDLTLVLIRSYKVGHLAVKTVWVNHKDDHMEIERWT